MFSPLKRILSPGKWRNSTNAIYDGPKTAYLILAHTQPELVARLVRVLNQPWAEFFIHIDSKFEDGQFKRALPPAENILYLKMSERVNVAWGGYSMVEATLKLIDKALQSPGSERFNRFCLLQGADYPLKPLSAIHRAFQSQTEFIRIDVGMSDPRNIFTPRAQQLWFHDFPELRDHPQLQGIVRHRKYELFEIYKGPAVWALTGEFVRYASEFIEKNHDYCEYMRFFCFPEEVFFSSILKASPFANQISHDFTTQGIFDPWCEIKDQGSHYVDWWEARQGNGHSKILEKADLKPLMESDALFARKFASPVSDSLLNLLDLVVID